MSRRYLLVSPAARSGGSLPVVIVLHGRDGSPTQIAGVTRMAAVTGPALLVYPAGYGHSWNAGGCCGPAHAASIDDVAFISELAERLRSAPVRPRGVYLVGFSNGGRMAYRLACAHPHGWAGIAVVEAVPAAPCTVALGLPMVIVANRHDPFYSMDRPGRVIQGYVEQSMAASVARWRLLDGCYRAPQPGQVGSTRVWWWEHCRGGAPVTYVVYSRPGHYWPRPGPARPGATAMIWAALHGVSLPVLAAHPAGPRPGADGESASA